MEEWQWRKAQDERGGPHEGILWLERTDAGEEREPDWRAGDGLRVLNP